MAELRLVADDLTGALDTAAEFVGLAGPILTYWAGALPSKLPSTVALDSGTRELSQRDALAVIGWLAPELVHTGLAYKKLDSLLRGNTVAEIAACFRLGAWPHCVVAPAFPYQGRITRGSRQFAKGRDGWSAVSDDLVVALAAHGLPVQQGRPDAELRAGVSVFDAENECDLHRVVAIARRAKAPVLWCGSGGLARALARGTDPNVSSAVRAPALGLFGSDQAVTARQLAACREHWLPLSDIGARSAALVRERLARTGAALVSFDLPLGLGRGEAALRIAGAITDLARELVPPGTLIVAGGETLRAACVALGAVALEVRGQVAPGLPRSVLRGGRWDAVEVISKSGAFGGDSLLRDLLERNGLAEQTVDR
jgi:uncharacterized protein YgbK (DUF1537 family)